MSEVLEGVLSEAKLDELASDLGIDPRALRSHPFFRVIRGRVLLTYPLRSLSMMPEMQPEVSEFEVDPGTAYHVALDHDGEGGALYGAMIMTNDAVTNITRRMKVTVDSVEYLLTSVAEVGGDDWWMYSLHELVKIAAPLKDVYIPFNKTLKLEYSSSAALVAGKYISMKAYWGLLPR